MNLKSQIFGAMFGLAIGDALGAPIESKSPGEFKPISDYLPTRTRLPGAWTDDTSMTLCLADSLVESNGFNPKDQLDRYMKWYKEGYLSSIGRAFGTGSTTRKSIERYNKTHNWGPAFSYHKQAGNGALMRLAPVPIFFHKNPPRAIQLSGESSRTTHGSRISIDACRYLGSIIVGILQGENKEKIVSSFYSPVKGYWEKHPLCNEVQIIADGSFKLKEPPEIKGKAYVVDTLESALWAFTKGSNFKETILLAVNLGDDADTVGAVCGQIAGSYYGYENIPPEWINGLLNKHIIDRITNKLYQKC